MKRLSIENIYQFLNKHYRLIIGSVFTLLVVIWGLIYYQNIYIPTTIDPALMDHKVLVNEEGLQAVLADLEDREDNLNRALKKTYPDLFSP